MAILLEVIVTSVHEAVEAERGGADRLELVTALEHGGFTPSPELVQQVVKAVSIPVRVMLRENSSLSITTAAIGHLRSCAARFRELQIDGLVTGFVKDGDLDLATTLEVLDAAPEIPVTFHRAFGHAREPRRALEKLKQVPQIDRVLTDGGEGSWRARMLRVIEWQRAAAHIKMIFATGTEVAELRELTRHPEISEVHVGRAARVPRATYGKVDGGKVAELKRALG